MSVCLCRVGQEGQGNWGGWRKEGRGSGGRGVEGMGVRMGGGERGEGSCVYSLSAQLQNL